MISLALTSQSCPPLNLSVHKLIKGLLKHSLLSETD